VCGENKNNLPTDTRDGSDVGLGSIFISYCYYKKLPKIKGLKTTKLQHLIVLEVKSRKRVSLS